MALLASPLCVVHQKLNSQMCSMKQTPRTKDKRTEGDNSCNVDLRWRRGTFWVCRWNDLKGKIACFGLNYEWGVSKLHINHMVPNPIWRFIGYYFHRIVQNLADEAFPCLSHLLFIFLSKSTLAFGAAACKYYGLELSYFTSNRALKILQISS